MRARLKSLTSDDIADLGAWRPPVADDFGVPLVLEVGALGQKGRERFELFCVTPEWLRARHGTEGAVLGRGLLVVFSWDYVRIRAFLARRVETCSGATWPDVARQVARIAEWEGNEENVVGIGRG